MVNFIGSIINVNVMNVQIIINPFVNSKIDKQIIKNK